MAVTKTTKSNNVKAQKDERPAIVDEFKDHRLQEKFHKEASDKLKPEVMKILKLSNYPDVYIQESSSDQIDESAAIEWARENLKPDQFKGLFVKVFDPNRFHALLQSGDLDRDDLPEGVITQKKRQAVYVK